METGRELDALIAEKIMRYKRTLVPKGSLPNTDVPGFTFPRQDGWIYINEGGYPDYFSGHCNDMYVDSSRGFKKTLKDIPEYSTDIAAAWEVVEKIKTIEINSQFGGRSMFFIRFDGGAWSAGWEDFVHDDHEAPVRTVIVEACELTAPHAICLAALKAFGYEFPSSKPI